MIVCYNHLTIGDDMLVFTGDFVIIEKITQTGSTDGENHTG